MLGVWKYQTIGFGQRSLIDMNKQAIGHIIQKIHSFFANSCIQMFYDTYFNHHMKKQFRAINPHTRLQNPKNWE